MDEVHAVVDGLLRCGMERAAAWHVEVAAAGAVYIMHEIEDAFGIRGCRFEEDRTGAVAEEDAGGAVGVVEDGGHHVTADDQYFFVRAAGDELRADGERIEKAGTGGGEIEAPGVLGTEAILNQARGGGEKHVGSDGGDDDQANVVSADAALG